MFPTLAANAGRSLSKYTSGKTVVEVAAAAAATASSIAAAAAGAGAAEGN